MPAAGKLRIIGRSIKIVIAILIVQRKEIAQFSACLIQPLHAVPAAGFRGGRQLVGMLRVVSQPRPVRYTRRRSVPFAFKARSCHLALALSRVAAQRIVAEGVSPASALATVCLSIDQPRSGERVFQDMTAGKFHPVLSRQSPSCVTKSSRVDGWAASEKLFWLRPTVRAVALR